MKGADKLSFNALQQGPEELIQKIVSGEIDSSENNHIIEEINSNPKFKQDFEDYSKLQKAIKIDKERQNKVVMLNPALKAEIMREVGFATKVSQVTNPLGAWGTIGSLVTAWFSNYKISIPMVAAAVAGLFYLYNTQDVVKLNSNKLTLSENNYSHNSNIEGQINTDKAQTHKSNNLISDKNIPVSKSGQGVDVSIGASASASVEVIKNTDNKKNIQSKPIEISSKNSDDNKNITTSQVNNYKDEKTEKTELGLNQVSQNSTLMINRTEIMASPIFENNVDDFTQSRYFSDTYIIKQLKLSQNNDIIDKKQDIGVTILFSQLTQLNKNEFAIAGFWKLNKDVSYSVEGGIEYNRVFLAPISNNLQNDGKYDGVGIAARVQSNGLISSIINSDYGNIVDPYFGLVLGSTTPGLYNKINVGLKLNLLEIGGAKISFITGYEYFGLLNKNPDFISERKSVSSGVMVKF